MNPQKVQGFKVTRAPRLLLIASYSAAGRGEEAREQLPKFQEFSPNFDPKAWIEREDHYRDAADVRRILDDLAKAGLK